VGALTWQRHATFRYRGERRLQHEFGVTVHPSTSAPSVDGALRVGYEADDYVAYRWWAVDEIAGSSGRFYPAGSRNLSAPVSEGRRSTSRMRSGRGTSPIYRRASDFYGDDAGLRCPVPPGFGRSRADCERDVRR
jgi:hypothetical protein